MRRQRQRGTTLLELLIALTLLTFISVGILTSMRVGVIALEKVNSRFFGNRRVLGVEKALTQQLNGLMPVPVECMGPTGVPGAKAVLFQGDPLAMRFVSSYSLQDGARGYPKLLELTTIPGEDGVGLRLIVNELPYSGPFSVRGLCIGTQPDPLTGQQAPVFPPVMSRPDSFILADQLASVRFGYRDELLPPLLERWTPKWQANRIPSAIRVEMVPLEGKPGGLQVSTVTIRIRANVVPMVPFND